MRFDSKTRTIETERLLLRMFELRDAKEVARLCDNEKIYKNTLYLPYPYKLEHAIQWIKSHEKKFASNRVFEFAITDREKGSLYGAIALSIHHAFNHGEIAYWVGEEYWGRGYATEASQAMLDFAFHEKKLHKVYARHFGTNPASGRVLEKIGMKKEGVLLEHIRKDGRYEDLVFYGILERDYKES